MSVKDDSRVQAARRCTRERQLLKFALPASKFTVSASRLTVGASKAEELTRALRLSHRHRAVAQWVQRTRDRRLAVGRGTVRFQALPRVLARISMIEELDRCTCKNYDAER